MCLGGPARKPGRQFRLGVENLPEAAGPCFILSWRTPWRMGSCPSGWTWRAPASPVSPRLSHSHSPAVVRSGSRTHRVPVWTRVPGIPSRCTLAVHFVCVALAVSSILDLDQSHRAITAQVPDSRDFSIEILTRRWATSSRVWVIERTKSECCMAS